VIQSHVVGHKPTVLEAAQPRHTHAAVDKEIEHNLRVLVARNVPVKWQTRISVDRPVHLYLELDQLRKAYTILSESETCTFARGAHFISGIDRYDVVGSLGIKRSAWHRHARFNVLALVNTGKRRANALLLDQAPLRRQRPACVDSTHAQ
jgi:hypothetical protein